jgi:hypothetical protein
MKKLLVALSLLALTGSALAQHGHHGYRHHGHPGYHGAGNWVVPIIIGGVVGAAIANRPVQAETVIVQRQPVIVQQQENCTPWKEIQTSDGRTYRERTCSQ